LGQTTQEETGYHLIKPNYVTEKPTGAGWTSRFFYFPPVYDIQPYLP